MTTIETTMATTIDDDSDNEGDTDNNRDNDNNHNGNIDEALMTRPQQLDHDNKTTMRYNNQLNGGPLAVDCDDDDDNDDDGDSNGNGNSNGKGDGDGEGDNGSTCCNDNNDDNNNNPLPIVVNVVVIQRLHLRHAVTTMASAGRRGGSYCWRGGDGNSDSACCNDNDIDHDDNHLLPVIVDVFVIRRLSLCSARSTMAVGRQRGSGCRHGRDDSSRQG